MDNSNKNTGLKTDSIRRELTYSNFFKKVGLQIICHLGTGSFAHVKKVFCPKTKTYMAVKIIKKETVEQPEIWEKFMRRELEIIKIVRHQNVIKFLKSTETSKHVYIFMELAHNGDLLQLIEKENGINEEMACRWFHQLVDGVYYCHSLGITHRDLKCENLLLNKHFVLKIGDFGFARHKLPIWEADRVYSEITRCETFCGDYAYASIEILTGKCYQPYLNDTWSMAVILYVMLYARFPFDPSDPGKYLVRVTGELRFPEVPKVSNSCKDLIKRILKPEEQRIYIYQIRQDNWYCNMYNSKWDEQVQKFKKLSKIEKNNVNSSKQL